MKFKQQLQVIQSLYLAKDLQTRMDCPFCNNKNTLSIDTTDNKIYWYCFHATCKARGKKQGVKDMQYVQKVFQGNKDLHIEDKDFELPSYFIIAFFKLLASIIFLSPFNLCGVQYVTVLP